MSISNILSPNDTDIYSGSISFPPSDPTATSSPLNVYEHYTNTTLTASGIWGAGVTSLATLYITRVGSMVSLKILMSTLQPATVAGIITMSSNIPTRFLPTDSTTMSFPCQITNNGGTLSLGVMTITSTGLTRFYNTIVSGTSLINGNFAANAITSGFYPTTVSWSI